jgi:hypothetical protein
MTSYLNPSPSPSSGSVFCESGSTGTSSVTDMYNSFSTLLLNFLNDLACSYPNLDIFEKSYNMVIALSNVEPTLVYNMVWANMRPFIHQIQQRDDSFFLEKDYKCYTKEFSMIGGNIDIIDAIKSIWSRSMSNEDKDCVWRHFDMLIGQGIVIANTNSNNNIINNNNNNNVVNKST